MQQNSLFHFVHFLHVAGYAVNTVPLSARVKGARWRWCIPTLRNICFNTNTNAGSTYKQTNSFSGYKALCTRKCSEVSTINILLKAYKKPIYIHYYYYLLCEIAIRLSPTTKRIPLSLDFIINLKDNQTIKTKLNSRNFIAH